MFLLMNKIKKGGSKLNSSSNNSNNTNSSGNKKFFVGPNIFYLILVSFCVSVILISLLGIRTVRNMVELYVIVLFFTFCVLYQILKGKNMTLDKLETKSILYFLGFIIFLIFFRLFVIFTSMEKESTEGKLSALIFLLLVFAFINMIFFIVGLA